MAFAESFSGTNGTWGTEYSLTGNTASVQTQTADGIYAPFIDCSAVARGDIYRLKAYEKVLAAGTQRKFMQYDIRNQQTNPLITIPPVMLLNGWDFTLQRIAGSDRTITYSVRGITGNVTLESEDSATISTSEYFLRSDSTTPVKQTTDGMFQVFLDVNAVAKADDFEFKVTDEARDADSTSQVLDRAMIGNDRQLDIWLSPTYILMNGWEFSLDKMAGTDRSIAWSIRKMA